MSELLGEVNRTIRNLAANVDPHDSSRWEFVCECGAEQCSQHLVVALARFDELKAADARLLAPGHQLTEAHELKHAEGQLLAPGHPLRRTA